MAYGLYRRRLKVQRVAVNNAIILRRYLPQNMRPTNASNKSLDLWTSVLVSASSQLSKCSSKAPHIKVTERQGTYRQSEKNSLNSNISPTCPYNMVNFDPLAAEIGSLLWGTPGNFNGFRVLAVLLHGTLGELVAWSSDIALVFGRCAFAVLRSTCS